MSGRHYQPFVNNSLAIRQEIQRFESVHPSIYAIYDLIDLISDAPVAQQIRDHVVCIEGEFQLHCTHFSSAVVCLITTWVNITSEHSDEGKMDHMYHLSITNGMVLIHIIRN
ncbi:UNVERIFIED_CONTAM: hypothetical protein PYX00_008123 [Menopon gallinae]|uniref:Uncharacterized protein n=1 Tax=Menopon gallinae TaxID=328185 RepID=A0AAW2HLP3_9NEOP